MYIYTKYKIKNLKVTHSCTLPILFVAANK